ncbi:MAG: ABC transporter permease [Thermoleophilaceae bacterium]
MLTVLAANLTRRTGRTLFTALGTALGVATIIALLAVTEGAKQTAGRLVHLGRADVGVFQRDAADPTTSVLPASLTQRLTALPEVARATPLLLMVEAVKDEPAAVTFGADPQGFFAQRVVMLSGRPAASSREVAIGDRLAHSKGWRPGKPITIAKRRFTITGVYHTGVFFQDSGALITLKDAQALSGKAGEATSIVVQLAPDASATKARREIVRVIPGVTTIGEASEAMRAGANGQLIGKAGTVIVVLALMIGGLAVMNTMLLATTERRGEFAVMSAVGWSAPEVAGLVLVEGMLTSLLGAAIGLAAGIAGSGPLVHALGASEFVRPSITAWALGRGLLVGCAIGIVGGLYPAWRAARLRPAPALAGR